MRRGVPEPLLGWSFLAGCLMLSLPALASALDAGQVAHLERVNQCHDCDLSGIDLHAGTFAGLDARRANLRRADLSKATLWKATLWGLAGANLRGADWLLLVAFALSLGTFFRPYDPVHWYLAISAAALTGVLVLVIPNADTLFRLRLQPFALLTVLVTVCGGLERLTGLVPGVRVLTKDP